MKAAKMDKEDWGGPSREEEEICLILLQQTAAPTPRHEWTENMQDAEPDGVNIAIDTPRAGEDPQRTGGEKTEQDTGNWTQQWRRRETKTGQDLETTQTQPTQCAKHPVSRPSINRWQRGWDHQRTRSKPGKCQLHRGKTKVNRSDLLGNQAGRRMTSTGIRR